MATKPATHNDTVLPLPAEKLQVSKESAATGGVRVSIATREREELFEELLANQEIEIERLPVGKTVDCAPEIRQEGDTVIIPVVEEVLVRQLLVKEEIRIRYVNRRGKRRERVTLRRQEAVIEKLPDAGERAAADALSTSNEEHQTKDREEKSNGF